MIITIEEAKEWMNNASTEELIKQLEWPLAFALSTDKEISDRGRELHKMICTELLKRIEK